MDVKQNFDALHKKLVGRTLFTQRLLQQKLREIASQRSAEICFILGNGPSLTWDVVQKLEKEITFGFNKIYLLPQPQGKKWHPTFYMVEDDLVLEQNEKEILAFCYNNPLMVSFFRFYRTSPYASVRSLFQYCYVDDNVNMFSCEPWKRVVSGQSVVYSALQMAFFIGFKKIVLVGVDFDFGNYGSLKTEDGVISGSSEQTHFVANYRKNNEQWNPPNLEEQRRYFQAAHRYAETLGVEIFDCTSNGKLDVFEKKELGEVLSGG